MSTGGGHMTGMRVGAVLAAALVTIAVISGCTPGSAASPSPTDSSAMPSPSDSSTPAPTVSPSSDALDFSIPACVDLLDLTVVQANFGAGAEFIGELLPAELSGVMAGPAAETALAEATQKHGCIWGIPQSDGGFTVVIAEIPTATRDALTAALGSSAFTGTMIGTSPAYVWEREDEVGTLTTIYAFASPVWVAVTGAGTTGSQTPITADILDHLRALYPGLGD